MPRAVAFTHPREAPRVIDVGLEAPSAGEVRVRIEACGLGVADYGFFQLDALPRVPLCPGFEAVGIIDAVGAGVRLRPDTRVGLTPLLSSCGGCERCRAGLEHWCDGARLAAWHRDGFLAEQVVVPAAAVVSLSPHDEPVPLAPLFATGWTAMAAVEAAGLRVGQRLGVVGVGGLGHLVVQLARTAGFEVAAVDLEPKRAALAGSLGATPEFSGEVEAVVVCTPSAQALQRAARHVRRGGTVVLAAASPATRIDLSLFETVMRGVTLRPVFLGSRPQLDETLRRFRSGVLVPRVAELPLAEVPSRFWALRDGGFEGRLVVTMR